MRHWYLPEPMPLSAFPDPIRFTYPEALSAVGAAEGLHDAVNGAGAADTRPPTPDGSFLLRSSLLSGQGRLQSKEPGASRATIGCPWLELRDDVAGHSGVHSTVELQASLGKTCCARILKGK
ncbi:hypothetical protein NDU88_002164 [Pleurodeles waltl]|uniref:Uncharacterized protein n=1 Tax=Pleurodeles waltl TaxID=8319 RepID=A0AAV7LZR3_PLEWA|nr:hypothetical protein NDU88_002164 [Pleurodeles waltl]